MEKDNYDIIDAYLLGTLTTEDQKTFEQRLENDNDLKQEFDIMKSIFQSAEMSAKEKLKIDFEKIHNKNFPSEKTTNSKTININAYYKWAAAIIFVIGISLTMWFRSNQNNSMSHDQLYASYFEPTVLDLNYRGTPSDNTLRNIETQFNAGNYQDFLAQFDQYAIDNEINPSLILSKGQAHLEMDQFSFAEQSFKSLLSDPLFEDQAKWLLGLTQIKQGKTNEALPYLKSIDATTKFGKQAKQLMDALN